MPPLGIPQTIQYPLAVTTRDRAYACNRHWTTHVLNIATSAAIRFSVIIVAAVCEQGSPGAAPL